MKTTHPPRHFLLIAGSSLLAVSAASAQNVSNTWDQNSDGNWTTATNWVGNTAYASGTGNTATFGNFIGADRTVTLNAPITIGNITASDTSHNYIISGANTLNLDVNTGTPIIDVTTSSRNLTISSQISGNEGLQKNGSGALTLSGDNIYSGVTSITGAILISHSNALGASGAGNHTTITATGATSHLRLSGGINSAENITVNGLTETISFAAAILNTSGSNTLSGNITLDNPSGAIRFGSEDGSLTFSGNISQIGTSQSFRLQARNAGSSITVNNAIANNGGGLNIYGNGLKDTTSGSVTLKGVSGSGIGNTEVSQNGTLILGVTNALNTTGNVTLGASGGSATGRDAGTFDLAGYDQTINALNSVSVVTDNSYRKVINSGGGTNILTLGNGGGSGTLNGQINGNIKLIKTGAGTQSLNDVNSYSGDTTVTAGTLALGVDDCLADTNVVLGTGTLSAGDAVNDTVGTLDVTGAATISLGSGATLAFAASNGVNSGNWAGTLTVTGFVSGASLNFGSQTGLTTQQLGKISADGFSNFSLDAEGDLIADSEGGSPYEDWAGGPGVAFDADANGDGVSNGLAFLLGADDKDVSALDKLPKVSQSGGNLILDFTCLKVAGRGTAVLKLQHSKDLGISDAWTVDEVAVPDVAGVAGVTDVVTFTVPTVNANPNLVDLRATIPASAASPGTKLFARLKAQP